MTRRACCGTTLLGELWRRTTIYMPRAARAACRADAEAAARDRPRLVREDRRVPAAWPRAHPRRHPAGPRDAGLPCRRAAPARSRAAPSSCSRTPCARPRTTSRSRAAPGGARRPGACGGAPRSTFGHSTQQRARRGRRLSRQVRDQEHRARRWTAAPRSAADEVDALPVREHVRAYLRVRLRPRTTTRSPNGDSARSAHAFGYRGHCLTKSRRYSTTFKALRQAREDHVHARLLARSNDQSQRNLAAIERAARHGAFAYAGQGHLTTADAFLAASAAARAREERRAAREALRAGPPLAIATEFPASVGQS